MNARSRWLLATALALGALLSGCGKSLPSEGANQGAQRAIPPVSPRGAGGLSTKNTTRLGGADAPTDAAAVALAVHPGLTAASRPEAVVVVDERDWPAALVASALASAPLKAPLLYSDGGSLPEVSRQALETMQPTGAASLEGAQAIQIAPAAAAEADLRGYRTRTLTGSDPYGLAAKVAALVSAIHGSEPRQVIVAAADGPPALAMPAAGLSAESGAPILLVSTTSVPAATAAALRRLHRPSIYVVGSSAAVSDAVLTRLGRYGPAQRIVSPTGRIAPEDPVGNAIAVALYTDGTFGWGANRPPHGVVFANAARPLDAPAAAPLSSSGDYAPLLALESPDVIPRVLSEYLSDIRPGYSEAPAYRPAYGVYNRGWLIGGEEAISATVQAELDSMLEIAPQTSTTSTTTAAEATTSLPLPKK